MSLRGDAKKAVEDRDRVAKVQQEYYEKDERERVKKLLTQRLHLPPGALPHFVWERFDKDSTTVSIDRIEFKVPQFYPVNAFESPIVVRLFECGNQVCGRGDHWLREDSELISLGEILEHHAGSPLAEGDDRVQEPEPVQS